MKLDKERQGKVNTIISDLRNMLYEFEPQSKDDKQLLLEYISDIICQLDTDIAIEVMEDFGYEGREVARGVKVRYGY